MTKSTKIMLSVISAVLAVCIVITAVVSVSKRRENNENEPSAEAVMSDTSESSENTDNIDSSQATSQTGESQSIADSQPTTDSAGNAQELSQKILGKWMDSANMSGYEFKAGGMVTVTYVNLTVPVVNFPINGSANGSYTLVGNDLTVNFSIYKKTITNNFTVSVENNTLTLINKEDNETSTYERVSAEEETSSQSASAENGTIYGSWQNGDASIKYTFNQTGIVNLEFSSAPVLGQTYTGKCDGVFILNGENLTIQYTVLSKQITDEYTYSISDNSMSLKDSRGNTTIFVRSTQSASGSSSLLGKWSDSSGMSGYEFKENGIVEVTYVNLTVPVLNMPINGSFNGNYAIDGNNLTITVSIYSKTITEKYTYSINGNTLTLTNLEDSEISTYTKQS
ncbi:MAG: DUF5640 domain-containing protein [Acutalibacteraceae bacterium]